jgi:hypothetical protein
MLSQTYYVILARESGRYLVVQPQGQDNPNAPRYLLLFRENFEAMTYLNHHGGGLADRFTVESVPQGQVKGLLQRWGFNGVGMVQDTLEPRIDFLNL